MCPGSPRTTFHSTARLRDYMYKHPNLFAERNIQRFPNSKLLAAPAMSFKLTMGIRDGHSSPFYAAPMRYPP
jgi:hypothetical protein